MKTKNGLKPKARLVARGFEEDCLNKSEKELSTCYKDTFHSILLLAIQNEWDLQTIDINTYYKDKFHSILLLAIQNK